MALDDHTFRLTVHTENDQEGEEEGEEKGEEGICGLINSDGEEVDWRVTDQTAGDNSIGEVRGEEERGEGGDSEEETRGREKTNLKREEEVLRVPPIHGKERPSTLQDPFHHTSSQSSDRSEEHTSELQSR